MIIVSVVHVLQYRLRASSMQRKKDMSALPILSHKIFAVSAKTCLDSRTAYFLPNEKSLMFKEEHHLLFLNVKAIFE
jgi:uncharacterized membrane protein YqhA